MSTRIRYVAEYDYPGMLFPESVTREIAEPTLDAVRASAPADTEGYFRADGWYAVTVKEIIEKRFVVDDGEEQWIRTGLHRIARWVVGERIHVDDIEDTDRNQILKANIRGNSNDGYGVLTRCGNWQIASDYDAVLSLEAVRS